MVIFRTTGDHLIINQSLLIDHQIWKELITHIKEASGTCLSVAMAALGLSTNFKEIRTMGHKPFVVGFITSFMIGITSLFTIKIFLGADLLN